MRPTMRPLLLTFVGVLTCLAQQEVQDRAAGGDAAEVALIPASSGQSASAQEGEGSPSSSTTSSSSSEERKREYIVGLYDRERSKRKNKGGEIVQMMSSAGKAFRCVLPNPDADEEEEEEGETSEQDMRDALIEKMRRVFTKRCLEKNAGYWSYEVCPFQDVNQFHGEAGMAREQRVNFHLGHYGDDFDEYPALDDGAEESDHFSEEKVKVLSSLPLPANAGHIAYAQRYIGGTSGRRTLVKYVCHQRRAGFDGMMGEIIEIEEPMEFHYTITVATPHACIKDAAGGVNQGKTPVPKLLKPLRQQCIYMNQGWWNYEFCYNEHVRQFHMETVGTPTKPPEDASNPEKSGEEGAADASATAANKKTTTTAVTTVDFLLGKKGANSTISIHKGDTPATSYASQYYSDGTLCDLTNQPRRIEVRFVCEAELAKSRIVSIQESSTCEYLMHVATPLICTNETFQPVQPKLLEIACHPVDEDNGAEDDDNDDEEKGSSP
eukprot:jgi/Bigna1/87274/estExt_fgenesh1_pg.C_180144